MYYIKNAPKTESFENFAFCSRSQERRISLIEPHNCNNEGIRDSHATKPLKQRKATMGVSQHRISYILKSTKQQKTFEEHYLAYSMMARSVKKC